MMTQKRYVLNKKVKWSIQIKLIEKTRKFFTELFNYKDRDWYRSGIYKQKVIKFNEKYFNC